MTTLRAYLVDDESLALKRLTKLLDATKRVDVVGSTTNPGTAVKFLSAQEVDVVFLDIHMPGLNGFEVLEQLAKQPLVVFTTAYDQYALKAFEVNSIDYLLKPIDPEDLDRALTKIERRQTDGNQIGLSAKLTSALAQLAGTLPKTSRDFPNQICSRVGDRILLIDLTQITHFYAQDKLTYAATEARKYVVDYTIASLEETLQTKDFVRIHRSTLINLAYLDELHRWFGGRLIARMKDRSHTELTVARNYAKLLKERLGLK
jgi:two-component system, LytTR family, response regulator